MCVCVCACHSTQVEVRGQCTGFGSLIVPINVGHSMNSMPISTLSPRSHLHWSCPIPMLTFAMRVQKQR